MNLGFPEMLFIFVVALLIFGPRKLPEIGRQVGKAMSEFKRASDEFKAQLDTEVRQLELEETRQRVTSSLSEPEISTTPPEGTVPTAAAYGDALDVEQNAAVAEGEVEAADGGTAQAQAEASTADDSPIESSSTTNPPTTEVTAAVSAENRNG